MANEYLKRQPTSSGNSRRWTVSFWMKNSDPTQGYTAIMGAGKVSPTNIYNELFYSGSQIGLNLDNSSDPENYFITADPLLRDPSAWMHVVLSFTDQGDNANTRVKFYINGAILDHNTSTSLDITETTFWNNVDYIQYIGSRAQQSAGTTTFDAQYTDIFLVDGQALTPDVFGFYKDGDGYVSAGSTMSTDFRPGQWVPKRPRIIKTEIERRGGFGVNGFYLPMNDSSNVGADFHCTPNSIITLKGEDLPQPRNGAPTTSDAYVSQLRQETGTLGFDGCVNFDGTNDYLSIGSAGDFNFLHDDTSSWTAEYFVYPKVEGTRQTIFSTGGNSSSTGFCARIMETGNTGGSNGYYVSAQTSKSSDGNYLYWDSNTTTLRANKWYHVALVYNNSNNTLKIYVDGELTNGSGTASEAGSFGSHSTSNSSFALRVGEEPFGGGTLDASAFISNLRIVNNATVYTSNFTAPTEPLANITNTTLLCCNSASSATASTVTPGTITANGNAFATRNELTGSIILACPFIAGGFGQDGAVSSTIPGLGDYHISLGGPSSVSAVNFLNGTGTQASISGSNGLYYGSSLDVTTASYRPRATVGTAFTLDGDYTIEFWAYINSFDSSGSHLVQYDTDAGATGWCFSADSGTARFFLRNSSGTDYNIAVSNVVPAGQWNHFAGVYESDKDRLTLYLNGVAVGTANVASNYLTSQYTNLNRLHIGSNGGDGSRPMLGYMQDLRVYKGLAKYKSGFEVSKPYTPVGIESWRTVADCTANNFATLNPLSYQTTGTYGTSVPVLSDGNLKFTHGQTGQWERSHASFGVGEGKWYCEFEIVTRPTGGTPPNNSENWAVGVRESDSSLFYGETDGFEDSGDHVYWIDANTAKIVSNQDRTAGSTSGITAVSNGDIINIAFEKTSTSLKVWFGINGTYFNSGAPASSSNPAVNVTSTSEYIIPAAAFYQYSGQSEPVGVFNFGQNPSFSGTLTAGTNTDSNGKGLFKYAPPSGFLALCEDNLPAPAVADPGDYFKTVLWTGDGNAGRSITGVGFQPDLVWIKRRNANSDHSWQDSVRGFGPTTKISSSSTYAENTIDGLYTDPKWGYLNSTNNNGFSLAVSTNGDHVNLSGSPYVAWCWKAGGAAVSNTDGSITSQVSVNQDAGFSIVTWLSNAAAQIETIGHGLGTSPDFMIVKNRDYAYDMWVWHKHLSNTTRGYLRLNTSDQEQTGGNDTWSTSSTTFGLRQSSMANANTDDFVAYCWAEIEGFSKFGSYEGNADADGPFVYCGFKPAFIMIKWADGSANWVMHDSSRTSTNPSTIVLLPDSNNVEIDASTLSVDFLSNGFKIRNTNASYNNTSTYIFAAFAESPFKTANAK